MNASEHVSEQVGAYSGIKVWAEEVEVHVESAVGQLERYRLYQETWCEQNVSNTISYDPEEVPEIIDWLVKHWESYVGVSFLFRNDPTKNAQDLGYVYLPQQVVTQEEYEAYVSKLKEVEFQGLQVREDELELDCVGGACPVR